MKILAEDKLNKRKMCSFFKTENQLVNDAIFCLALHITVFVLLQPLRWRCVDCVIHHERDVREE